MSQPPERAALAKGLVFVGAATLIGNGAAYLLSMVSARVLSPADFGALGALLGLLVIISTVAISTQALTARRVAVATDSRLEVEGEAIRLSAWVGAAIVAGGVVLAWPLGQLFAIPVLAVGTGSGGVLASLAGPALMLATLCWVTGIPYTEAQALRTRGDDYRDYQRTTSVLIPWRPRKS